jgi:hypothetical protein
LACLPLQTRSNNTWLISLNKQDQTTLGSSPFTNKIKQHLACLPLEHEHNNVSILSFVMSAVHRKHKCLISHWQFINSLTWLISLYKQDQTTLGLSPFTNKIKQHLACLPSPNQVKTILTIKYQTIYKDEPSVV